MRALIGRLIWRTAVAVAVVLALDSCGSRAQSGMSGMSGMAGMSGTAGRSGRTGTMSGPMWMPSAAPTFARLIAWHPQPIPVEFIGCLLAAAAYGCGMARMHRRGDRWPVGRTVWFAAGLLSVIAVTTTGVGGYGMELFSVHMVQHMVLSMFSPILLLLGAPVTLALRTLPQRPRRLLLSVLHSRLVRVVSSPLVSLPLFLASLYGLYFTPLFDLAMRGWWGHEWMLAHFLAVGLLFMWPLVGVDPAPHAPSHLLRILELLVGVPFHAFFGIAIMSATTPVVQYFRILPAAWHDSVLHDQYVAGSIAWAFSEVPSVLVILAIFWSWSRSEERRAHQLDRKADRDGDADLAAYNAYLARIAAADRRVAAPLEPGRTAPVSADPALLPPDGVRS
jgi:putative membrane protein